MANFLETRILSTDPKEQADSLTSKHPALQGIQHFFTNPDFEKNLDHLAFFDLSDFLLETIQQGNSQIAKKFLENNTLKFSEEAKALAMKLAAEQNALDLLEVLVEKTAGEIQGFSMMLELIKFAVSNGRLALLQSLLDKGLPHVKRHLDKVGPNLYKTLFDSFIGETYIGAAEGNQLETVRYLHEKVGPFPPATNGAAFRAAGMHGHLTIVQFLLLNAKDKLPAEEVKWLFEFATNNNKRQPLLEILLKHASELLADKKIEQAFLHAIRHECFTIASCLYEHVGARISASVKIAAVKAAALTSHLPTIQMLLPGLPNEGLIWLLRFACEKSERLGLLRIVLKEGAEELPKSEFDRLFWHAVQKNQLTVADCLFEKVGTCLADNTLKDCLKASATQEDLAMVRFLLNQAGSRFSWWDKVRAFWAGFQAQPRSFFSLFTLIFSGSQSESNQSAVIVTAESATAAAIEVDDLLLGKAFTPGLRQYMAGLSSASKEEISAVPEPRSKVVLG